MALHSISIIPKGMKYSLPTMPTALLFGSFKLQPSQIFYESALCLGTHYFYNEVTTFSEGYHQSENNFLIRNCKPQAHHSWPCLGD